MNRRLLLPAAVTAALLATAGMSGATAAPVAYTDAKAPVAARVADLLKRMTLAEKAGQMVQIRVGKLRGNCDYGNGPLVDSCMADVLATNHAGSILSGGGDTAFPDNSPKAWAETINAIQRYALTHNRLRIPIIYGADGVHGHNDVSGATIFPHQIGLGATWDPALTRDLGVSTANAMVATGVKWNFAPVSDIARDTRWGRYYETYSEDPFLAGQLAAGAVTGMQSSGELTATGKHFAGYSEPRSGHDRTPAQLPIRYLQDVFLPSFQAQIDAGVDTVMPDSGSVNSIPVHSSKYMLTDQLRQRLGFRGVVISDWNDIAQLASSYHIVSTYQEAIAVAVNAGVDMAMEPADAAAFTQGVIANVNAGRISQARIDEAVGHILTLKFTLGLFDHPYVDPNTANQTVLNADRPLARKAATESIVLLRNQNNVLPLSVSSKIVLTGDSADNLSQQMGGWTIGWQGIPDDNTPKPPVVTPLQALKEAAGDNVTYAPDAADAVSKTASADAAVVVLGEKPGAEGPGDVRDPSLSTAQQQLVDSLQQTGKPVIVVIMTGRPRALGAVADANAIVQSWLPGTEGGHAISDVLYGKANPSGKLPVSWPKVAADEPMSYQTLPANGTNTYDPAYPFGFGLSYTTFATSGLTVTPAISRTGTATASVTVRNTGSRAGTAVVPVYLHRPVSPVLMPARQLIGFARVTLDPGAAQTVTVPFAAKQLAVTTGDVDGAGVPRVLPGGYQVVVDALTADFTVR
ncbi:glycoside hydrolase family 3 N-terminal domain-containing protein [Fodinicola acaciae]|uniref:glycoside hydrolase family 3 N-terminal domain-containing protein n=1 Tax=Fodinicola acaciae TaxID=2681555 RepID=UPI001C9E33A0|nr:glycoside hydrolase family 3 N-terminal domain-containing protein [Fodinicola acaciae]